MVGAERATQDLIDALQTDRDTEETRANTAEGERNAANMTLGAVRMALYLMADADQAAIMAAIMGLKAEDPALAAVRMELGLADDANQAMIIAAIDDLSPAVPPAPTPKAMAMTDAIVAPSKAGDPSTARGIHYTGRPGNTGDQIFVRMGNSEDDTSAAHFLRVPLPVLSLRMVNLNLRTN